MRIRAWHWAAAVLVSGILHAGAAGVFLTSDESDIQIEGSAGLEIALLGTLDDAMSAGEPVETAEPLPPVEAEVEPVPPSAVTPRPPVETVESTEPAAVAPAETAEPLTTEPVEAAQVLVPAPSVAPQEVEEPQEVTRAEVEAVEPVDETAETLEPDPLMPETAPLPAVRPEPVVQEAMARPERVQPKPVEKKAETPKPRKSRPSAGASGKSDHDSRKGQSDGSEDGRASASGSGERAGGSGGNAAVSNYPGKVLAKLRRSLRYPTEAKRKRLRGEVQVQFTVSANGGVRGIRVVRSSGSPILDKAAIETVQRAAPFPSIPKGAGRSTWNFTSPLAFGR